MRVAIIDSVGLEYNGDTLNLRGLGGSESAVICIAKELVAIGVDVTVYCKCDLPGNYYGAEYVDNRSVIKTDHFDVVISSRSILPLYDKTITADKKVVWLHDTFCVGDDALESAVVHGVVDEVWTLSDFHTSYVTTCNHGHKRMVEVFKRKIWQTRNGVNLYNDYVDIDAKKPMSFVWNSATNKGLEVLFRDVWPHMYDLNCTLTVIGGHYNIGDHDEQEVLWRELKDSYDGRNGVTFTGIIKQSEVAEILTKSQFMLYPQSLPETYGISIVESLAYGVPVITGRFGAAEETAIESASYLMDYPVESKALYTFNKQVHLQHFLALVRSAMDNQYVAKQKANRALVVRDVCEWSAVALQWKQHLYKMTGRYLPIEEYKRVKIINKRCKEIFNTKWCNEEEHVVEVLKHELPIDVIVTWRNAENYVGKCLESISAQDYGNYRVWSIDDCSDDDSRLAALEALDAMDRNTRLKFTNFMGNQSITRGALGNQVERILASEWNDMDTIIVLIDGDDALVNDPNIFRKINNLHQSGYDFTYGSCHSMADNIDLIAQEYSPETKKSGRYKDQQFAWKIPYTHIRTFKRSLYNRIDRSALLDSSGNYYRAGGDAALFYALLDACPPDRIRPIRDVWYLYNDLNPLNDYKVNAEEQNSNLEKIMKR